MRRMTVPNSASVTAWPTAGLASVVIGRAVLSVTSPTHRSVGVGGSTPPIGVLPAAPLPLLLPLPAVPVPLPLPPAPVPLPPLPVPLPAVPVPLPLPALPVWFAPTNPVQAVSNETRPRTIKRS